MAEISSALLGLNEKVETSIQKQSQFEQRVSDRFNEVQVLMENQTVRVNGANRVAKNLHFDQQLHQQQEQLQQQQLHQQQMMQQQQQLQQQQYPQMFVDAAMGPPVVIAESRDGSHHTHPRRHARSSSMRGIQHI